MYSTQRQKNRHTNTNGYFCHVAYTNLMLQNYPHSDPTRPGVTLNYSRHNETYISNRRCRSPPDDILLSRAASEKTETFRSEFHGQLTCDLYKMKLHSIHNV